MGNGEVGPCWDNGVRPGGDRGGCQCPAERPRACDRSQKISPRKLLEAQGVAPAGREGNCWPPMVDSQAKLSRPYSLQSYLLAGRGRRHSATGPAACFPPLARSAPPPPVRTLLASASSSGNLDTWTGGNGPRRGKPGRCPQRWLLAAAWSGQWPCPNPSLGCG